MIMILESYDLAVNQIEHFMLAANFIELVKAENTI